MKISSLLINTLTATALTSIGIIDARGAQVHVSPSDNSTCGDVGLNLQYFRAQVDYDTHLNKFKRKYPDVYKRYTDLVKANANAKSFEDLRSQLVSHKSAAAEALNKIFILKKNLEIFQNLKVSKETRKKEDIQPASQNVHKEKGSTHVAQH